MDASLRLGMICKALSVTLPKGDCLMHRFTNILTVSLLICIFKIPACGTGFTAPTQETYSPTINPADFLTTVDNPYMPLRPGATYIYEGVTEQGSVHNEIQILSETKTIMGVTCTIV